MYRNQRKGSKISFTDDETWSTVLNPKLSCNYHSGNSLSFPERKKKHATHAAKPKLCSLFTSIAKGSAP
jgi:hypothetical protein